MDIFEFCASNPGTPMVQLGYDFHAMELRCKPTETTLHDSIGTRTISVRAGSSRTPPADQQGDFKQNGNLKSNGLIMAFSTSVSGYTMVYCIWRQTYFGRRTFGFVFGLLGRICFCIQGTGHHTVVTVPSGPIRSIFFHQVHIGNLMTHDVTHDLFETCIPQIF